MILKIFLYYLLITFIVSILISIYMIKFYFETNFLKGNDFKNEYSKLIPIIIILGFFYLSVPVIIFLFLKDYFKKIIKKIWR